MRTRQSMVVPITPELAAVAAAPLTSGRCSNASAVIRAAPRPLKDAEARRGEARLPRRGGADAGLHGR